MEQIQKQGGKKKKKRRTDAARGSRRRKQAMATRIAKEALEHAMESRDIATITSAIEQHRDAAADTDALWRATQMRKELIEAAKAETKRQQQQAAASSAPAKPTESDAISDLERRWLLRTLAS